MSRTLFAPEGKKFSCGNAGGGLGVCLRSPIIRSQVNSRNSCRRRRRRHRRRRLCTTTLVKATKAACGRAAHFIYEHARLACKSSIRRNILTDGGLHFLAMLRRGCTHNSRRRRHSSSMRKRRELVIKAREFIIVLQ